MTARSTLRHFQTNRRLPCSVTSCTRHRAGHSRYCTVCRRKVSYWGHEAGRCIRKQVLAPYRQEVSKYLDQYASSPQVSEAVKAMSRLLQGRLGLDPMTLTQLTRISREGVDGREALEIVGSVMLYSHRHPKALVDDARLTQHVGFSLLHSRPLPIRVKYGPRGKEYRQSMPASTIPRREVGRYVRDVLGVFLRNLFDRMDQDHSKLTETKLILSKPLA